MLNLNILQAATFALLLSAISASPIAELFGGGPKLPGDDPFYTPPRGYESAEPGAILRHRPVPQPLSTFKLVAAHQILFRTTDSFGRAVATVTTVLVPPNANKDRLLSYQVAEDAADVNCAPSYVFQQGSQTGGLFGTIATQAEMAIIEKALEKGWYVAVPDFLGPRSAFLANNLAGFAVLDGVRAALASSNFTQLAADPAVALWGYSGGSLASGFAAELQPCYAPELKILGAALGGTCPDILSVLYTINKSVYAGLIGTGVVGLSNEYPEVASLIQEQLRPEKKAKLDGIRSQCLGAAVLSFLFQDIFAYVKDPGIFKGPVVLKVIAENNMGHSAPRIPLLVYKGVKDEISPVADTDKLVKYYCDGGSAVDYRRIPTEGHLSLLGSGASTALAWLDDRLTGAAVAGGCTTTSS
ncbi:secretory lipase [Cordyceps javanica]|uniref:Secretory lipase n=1 Tax=Cordyceps javanica TaxID=43265 RepID=A0A545W038_9HYPO|nr:secretory lipase [Cordyceps javanica]TQW07340.1 secretory lipase [Cordyceps javanica]